MPLTPGTHLGTYEIVAPLGAGGMGEVYRAKDLRLGREIALKVLPDALASAADHLVRFEREARILAGLNHPNIVTLFSVEDEDDVHFLTMELVTGQSLLDLVAPGGLPLPRVLDMAVAIADALTAAHEKGVVHRDLKPANVMVTREGRVKVLDFGLAKLALASPSASAPATAAAPVATVPPTSTSTETLPPTGARSRAGMVAGTLPYMAPEQIRAEAVDARTDLFAFGILLYELLAGRRPFTESTAGGVSAAILDAAPEPLNRARADLPGDLERIVNRCLEKHPRDRFQTALDLSNELRRLGRGLERGERGEPGAAEQPASEKVASIAVLPFVNRSASMEDEYFSDGLADELLNLLAKIKGLRVAARTSAFNFKGKNPTIAEVGHALNVATVLDGSVRKVANRVRISVQLVQVADGYHLWSETYDRTLEDLFAVQDDIAQSVVSQLRATLLGENVDSEGTEQARTEVARAVKGRGTDPEAHRIYLMARHLNDRITREDTAKAIEYLKESLERDPEFAFAWAELSRSYSNEAINSWVPVAEGYERSRKAAERALALEPDLAEGHSAIAWIRLGYDWDWHGADASGKRALELAPGNALVLRRAGALAHSLGRIDEGIVLCRRAVEQDPLNAGSYGNLAHALHSADRLEEAEQAYRRARDLAPRQGSTFALHALIMLDQGRVEEALAAAIREPDEAFRAWALGIVHHAAGHHAESDDALQEMIANSGEDCAYQIAEVHAMRGETSPAFEWLERSYGQRDTGLIGVKYNPRLRSLHGDPRWEVFMKKMGF